jgi:hypothetical protein
MAGRRDNAVVTPVHTTGINWASVLTLIISIVGLLSLIIGGIVRTSRGFLRQQSKAITDAVDHLAESLEARLETKDRVNAIAQDLAILKTQVQDIGKHPNTP